MKQKLSNLLFLYISPLSYLLSGPCPIFHGFVFEFLLKKLHINWVVRLLILNTNLFYFFHLWLSWHSLNNTTSIAFCYFKMKFKHPIGIWFFDKCYIMDITSFLAPSLDFPFKLNMCIYVRYEYHSRFFILPDFYFIAVGLVFLNDNVEVYQYTIFLDDGQFYHRTIKCLFDHHYKLTEK